MSVLPTYLDPTSAEFQANAAAMRALLDEFHARQIRASGGHRGYPNDPRGPSCRLLGFAQG